MDPRLRIERPFHSSWKVVPHSHLRVQDSVQPVACNWHELEELGHYAQISRLWEGLVSLSIVRVWPQYVEPSLAGMH